MHRPPSRNPYPRRWKTPVPGEAGHFNVPQLLDPAGQSWNATYDAKGNPSTLRDALNQAITLGNTADFSRLDWLKDQRNNLTDFVTDGQGNLTRIVYPDPNQFESFTYENGNVKTVTSRRGQTTTFNYNSLGRLGSKVCAGGRMTLYVYDARGNLTHVIDSVAGAIDLTYDDRDFLTRIDYADGPWFAFEYNPAGRRTKRTSHDGDVLKYEYDPAGRLEYLRNDANEPIVHYSYDPVGRLQREDKGNGTYTTYDYYDTGQLWHLVNCAPDGTAQSRFDYTYDANGDPNSMTTLAGTTSYTYDAIGQLTGVAGPSYTMSSVYDAAGNRISVTENGTPTAYTTNNMNQYTQLGSATDHYDADGNLDRKTDTSGTTTYEYDEENRLTRVVTPTEGTWVYTYDGLGNRIRVEHNGQVTRCVHDPAGLVDLAAEYDGNGAPIARYTHGLGLVSRTDTSGSAYYGYDAIGNTRQLTDAAGDVANTYDYAPFGAPLAVTETIPNPFRFVGRFAVAGEANELVFMRARYCNVRLGRYISPGPLNLAGGLNRYSYVSNNPTTYVDPSGLSPRPSFSDWFGNALSMTDLGQTILGRTVSLVLQNASISYLAKQVTVGGFFRAETIGTLGRFAAALNIVSAPFDGWEAGRAWEKYGFETAPGWATGNVSTADLIHDGALAWGKTAFWLLPFGQEFIDAWDRATLDLFNTLLLGAGYSETITSWDPNEKRGPAGCNGTGHIPMDGQPLVYTIFFENDPNASAPAQEVFIADYLDRNLDWTMFELGEIAFGSQTVTELGGLSAGSVRVPLSGSELVVDISGQIDQYSGRAGWTFRTIDPATGTLPADPNAGFLPPNDANHAGEGHVTFAVVPHANLATGTQLANSASIVFDTNPPMITNTVTLTVRFAGDMNCDCRVDFTDIDPFVLALSDPAAYQAQYPNCDIMNGDCNGDGNVDFGDIDPFVALLSG